MLLLKAKKRKSSAINQIAKEEKLKPEILNSDLDPTAVKRTGIGNKVTLLDLVEFSNDLSFSPSAKKTIREKSKNIHNTISLQNSNIITQSDALNNIQAFDKSENIILNEQSEKTDVEKPLSKLRQSIASRLKQAQNTAAMLTTFNEIDMFKIISIRNKYKDRFLEKYGVKLGFMSFLLKQQLLC